MCEAITWSLALGIASAGMGAVSSIASYQSQSQAATASEQAYQQQRDLNQQAANRAYQQTQLKFKGERDQATQKTLDLLTKRLQAQGNIMASGRTGQSVGALLTDAQRTEGRDLGTIGLNLAYAQQDYGFGMESISSNNKQETFKQPPNDNHNRVLVGWFLVLGKLDWKVLVPTKV
jgi:hypothetical protein